jgi:CubicO group peptidase (beta-lactamase class C family)
MRGMKTAGVRPATTCLLLVIFCGLPLAAASAPTVKPEDVGLSAERLQRINQMMRKHIAAGEISGGVTLVARRGRIAHLQAFGTMDVETKTPMAVDSVFRIASMTKPTVGVAIMMMLEEGKLRLNDPVSMYIPEFKGMKVAVPSPGSEAPGSSPQAAGNSEPQFSTVPAEREITIRDLLTHTSGLMSGPMSTSAGRKFARTPTDTLADYIPRLGATPLEFQPGSQWRYSPSAGFDTLARIVEITSGRPFDKFEQERLFDPLGMTSTSFYPTPETEPRLVTAYRLNDGHMVKNPQNMSSRVYFSGGGGLISTAEDYAKFAQMLLNGGELNGHRFLSPRTVELMSSVHIPDTLPGRPKGEGYGLSVRVVNNHIGGGQRISDGSFGWSGAYGTHFWVDPKEGIVAILMIQTPVREMRPEFENAVMQAIIE